MLNVRCWRRRRGVEFNRFESLDLSVLKQQEAIETKVFSLRFSDKKSIIEENEIVVGGSNAIQKHIKLSFAMVSSGGSDEFNLTNTFRIREPTLDVGTSSKSLSITSGVVDLLQIGKKKKDSSPK